jgi:low affinity Fe/Cu permease
MADRNDDRRIHTFFTDFSTWVAKWTGSHWAFFIAGAFVLLGLILRGDRESRTSRSPSSRCSWCSSCRTQNRDSAALHLKLDEVVRVQPEARDEVQGIESRTEEEIRELAPPT